MVPGNDNTTTPLSASDFQCCGGCVGGAYIILKQGVKNSQNVLMYQCCGEVGGSGFTIVIIG